MTTKDQNFFDSNTGKRTLVKTKTRKINAKEVMDDKTGSRWNHRGHKEGLQRNLQERRKYEEVPSSPSKNINTSIEQEIHF